jgi:2-oxoisovalerate dehydrogenase E1 component
MTKDLHEPGDSQWLSTYPSPDHAIALGQGAVYLSNGPGGPVLASEERLSAAAADLTIITYANGLYMSLRAARTLWVEHEISARIVDLRWLSPLNEEFIVEQSLATGRALVVDEGRHSGGVSEAILALLMQRCGDRVAAARVVGRDTYIPLGPAANEVLPTEEDILQAALRSVADSAVTSE